MADDARILVLGCGAIGGTLAGHLLAAGHNVFPVSRNPSIVAACQEGLRLSGVGGERTVAGRVWAEVPTEEGPFDFVFLATQPPDVEEAALSVRAHLAPGGRIVCLPNGLCEERVARALGSDEQVLGGVVSWGASMPEPGLFERTSAGRFTIGGLGTGHDRVLVRLADILTAVDEVRISPNLRGARWSKLAINCAVSSLGTLGGERLGVLMRRRIVRRLTLEIMTEVVQVAHACDVRLERVAGALDLDWIALDETDAGTAFSPRLAARHSLLLAVGFHHRRLRSSMLAALERGRPPAVDFLNGEIVSRAADLGLGVPVNRLVQTRVHALFSGAEKPGAHQIERLYQDTRPEAVERRARAS